MGASGGFSLGRDGPARARAALCSLLLLSRFPALSGLVDRVSEAVSRRSQQACLAVEAPFPRTRRRQGRNLGRGVRQGPGRAEGPAATGLQPGRREQAVQEAVSAWTWPLPGAWPRFSVFPKEGSSCLLINQETAVPGRREGAPGRGGPGDLGPLQEATSLP